MAKTSLTARILKVLPINRYHKSDTIPNLAVDINKMSASKMMGILRISKNAASKMADLRKRAPAVGIRDLLASAGLSRADYEKVRRCALTAADGRFTITDVQPAQKYIFSDKPFAMRVKFINPAKCDIVVACIRVLWRGQPFVVEQMVSSADQSKGFVDAQFDGEQTLPPGPAAFIVDLFDKDGGQSSFKVTCVVLPSNPLSLSISPSTYYVTGTYSARGYYDSSSNKYKTVIKISIYNGNSSSVSISKAIKWEFWDGGVGGSKVESGTHNLSSNFSIAAYSSWSVTLIFSSPSGSGIYNTYNKKEDMTIRIEMQTTGGTKIDDTLTARVMLGYGVDIIRVASDTFVGQEYTDLYDAVDVTKDIYEARDITLRSIGKYHIHDADAGSYKYMNSESECKNLFDDWSAAPGGTNIDAFVAHDFVGVGFDGLAGGIPGPTSHSGNKSGVVVDKTGYVDASGVKRLSVEYLGMLIGHELGHYLGLSHVSTSGNLMLSSSGTYDTDLTYDQYRTIMKYGWVFVD